jgi:hypothetical protein
MNANPENEVKPAHLGGGYLKPGILKPNRDGTNQKVRCQISARNGGTRLVPAHGKFSAAVEIPITIDGVQKIVSLPDDSADVQALRTVFGPEYSAWSGHTVEVFESDILEIIRIVPVS